MDLFHEWAATVAGWIATTLLGLLVVRIFAVTRSGLDFMTAAETRIGHIDALVSKTLKLHTDHDPESLFQVGRVIEVLLENGKQAQRIESLLTANFELQLLMAGKLETPEDGRAVKAIERELRGSLLNHAG